MPQELESIVCLGGGVGTAQVLTGLRKYDYDLTAVVSMADDGGSAGRLRRAFAIPPPGDLINCLASLSEEESVVKDLLIYRFAQKGSKGDTDLGGHKLGNLIFLALTDIYKGDIYKALEELSKIISSKGKVLPATTGDLNIWAQTKDGKKIYGEANIDLGKYRANGPRSLYRVHLDPSNIKAYKPTIEAILKTDALVVGPGDLFSTTLPVLIVPEIKKLVQSLKVPKIFIVNIANKPFETAGFKVSDFVNTLRLHLGGDFFDAIIVNTNHKPTIPKELKYDYVIYDKQNIRINKSQVIEGDFIDQKFPIYHNSQKISHQIDILLR